MNPIRLMAGTFSRFNVLGGAHPAKIRQMALSIKTCRSNKASTPLSEDLPFVLFLFGQRRSRCAACPHQRHVGHMSAHHELNLAARVCRGANNNAVIITMPANQAAATLLERGPLIPRIIAVMADTPKTPMSNQPSRNSIMSDIP